MKFASIATLAAVALLSTSNAIQLKDDDETTTTQTAEDDASATLGINILTQGTGDQCKDGQTASVHYTGSLASDGSVFDSSIPRGEPISFELGVHRVISCWDQAIVQFTPGTKADITCPPSLAYGQREKPKIPAGSTLKFNVEVMSCQ